MSGLLMELVSRAHLSWKRRVARQVAPFGVNPKQLFVLRKLKETGGLQPSQIADLIFADRPTVTSLLTTMERARWISRQRDPANRKQVIVSLTKTGRDKLNSVPEPLWRSGKTGFNPEAGLTAPERAELTRLMEKLNDWLATPESKE